MKTILGILAGLLVVAGVFLVLRGNDRPDEKTPEQTEEKVSLPAQEGLPPAVESKRQAIAEAESYDELAALAGENFSYSFGGPHAGGFGGYLREYSDRTEEDMLEWMKTILSLPYSKRFDTYVWPSVFAKEAKDWTEEDMKMMRELYSEEDIESFRLFGSYIGYRIGIREDGEWIYFIAGD